MCGVVGGPLGGVVILLIIVILLKEGWKEGVWLKTSLGRKGVYYANEPT